MADLRSPVAGRRSLAEYKSSTAEPDCETSADRQAGADLIAYGALKFPGTADTRKLRRQLNIWVISLFFCRAQIEAALGQRQGNYEFIVHQMRRIHAHATLFTTLSVILRANAAPEAA